MTLFSRKFSLLRFLEFFAKFAFCFWVFRKHFASKLVAFNFFTRFIFASEHIVSDFKGAVPRDFRPFDLPTPLAVVITSVYFRQERTDASRSRTGRIRSIGQMQNKTYTGQEGSRKGQDRQAEQDVCKTVSMQDSMHERRDWQDVRQDWRRTGRMHVNVGGDECWAGSM